jgi:predicted transcriptional regulator
MTKYKRNKYEIINSILKSLYLKKIGEYGTRLAQKANLSPQMHIYYFGLLMRNRLVEKRDNKYFLTGKGLEYLKKSNRMMKELEIK